MGNQVKAIQRYVSITAQLLVVSLGVCFLFVAAGQASPDGVTREVVGFSKDSCDGTIGGGDARILQCSNASVTLCVTSAKWSIPLQSNPARCGDCAGLPGVCDESGRERDGVLEVDTSFSLRINEPCRFRGCWDGSWSLRTEDGTLFRGTGMGTFGSGSHRRLACTSTDIQDRSGCEDCYDVSFTPVTPNFGVWRVGVEGAFRGSTIEAFPPAETICFTISGDLVALGTCKDGPFDPNSFVFFGTVDGAINRRCN